MDGSPAECADEIGVPSDPEYSLALVSYLEWGTRLAVITPSPAQCSVRMHPCPVGVGAK